RPAGRRRLALRATSAGAGIDALRRIPYCRNGHQTDHPEGTSEEIDMRLRELFTVDSVKLQLEAEEKDDLLRELIALLGLDDKSEAILFKTVKRRENL